ncbi:TPA: hypothetical protein DD690_02505 [Candidatus Daviesbacteria bacterium]|uniref:Uncharacterized protein n=1 Tax=Candidatus Daviesbacteria bacterium GW2011_GWF2_38_6 TaxID=1618432 RepID=A0A0G0KTF0_9BACT|nr:MAG: hypothetical protein US99_C0011G0015 [Candidatus Daviesbacteria bacterium GW2011_GWF2_38_6]OGE27799.1 MAG: hypothetical protein A2772_02175 [Candidatus Daviesbacteria bacterium RIFCSPHIGHO2_01_FULL_38_8b]OGE27913.1 MAG: hypothetical protein A3D02_02445 [Candidatus Daviesbacteria bacterium RIFCSPHIGHO2_02_FULL_39_41]OGE45179.1 MAG: hypothetical protein A3E67_03170 [Candidatus Daviesbacteria bacterium RIFCSPHIGHO2_12_FULL_38_25]OGE68371.1 MAG: hypothetical protein A3H81_02445 [Candidatus 
MGEIIPFPRRDKSRRVTPLQGRAALLAGIEPISLEAWRRNRHRRDLSEEEIDLLAEQQRRRGPENP